MKPPSGSMKRATNAERSVCTLPRPRTFTYDPNGNLLTVTDTRHKITSYTYDAMNRLLTLTDPLSHVETLEYDKLGNITKRTDRKGQVTQYQYDSANRLKLTTFNDLSTITL